MLYYMAHPIKPLPGGTIEDNIKSSLFWYRHLLVNGLHVVAPYFGLLQALDDFNPEERKLGMYIDNLVKPRTDGLVVVGSWELVQQSEGVQEDINDFITTNRPYLNFTDMSPDEATQAIARHNAQISTHG